MPEPSSPFDPLAIWRDLVSQWEKGANQFANEAMASDPFRQGMHGGMNATLTAQKAIGELMARYLTTLNLPTRDDLQALGGQLQRIDEHLAHIARLLEGGAGPARSATVTPPTPPAALDRPARTRKPPGAPAAPPPAAAKRTRGHKP